MKRKISLILITLLIISCNSSKEKDSCIKKSEEAIAFGKESMEYCYEKIDPRSYHHDIKALDNCIEKHKKTIAMVDEVLDACANESKETFDEVLIYKNTVISSMKTFEMLKDVQEGNVTDMDMLKEILKQN